MESSDWYKRAVFYEIYLRSFKDGNHDGIGDLIGLRSQLDYLRNLGVDCIWLLPIFPSPRRDDGYDISDYYSIDKDYGTIDDLKRLIEDVHKNKMHIMMDLVVNHTSDQHPWFQAAREGKDSPYFDYYVWSDSDQRYKDARIIFLDVEKSNWHWDPQVRKYYWHRFYSSQPDLNYDNPRVKDEMLYIMRFWLEMGIDGFRVDAVPYLIERDGTSCENLPETHQILKEMREFIDKNYKGRILLCEANQRTPDLMQYLNGDDEFHMAFHFPLMPKIFIALCSGDAAPIIEAIEQTPQIPANCQWGTFLRNHDELTLEMVTGDERQWLWKEYAPRPEMRQNLGIRRRLAPLLDNDHRKILLAFSLIFSLPGAPFIYYGDEIGMGENLDLPDRNCVRTPMQWDSSKNGGFTLEDVRVETNITDAEYLPSRVNVDDQLSNENSLLNKIKQMIVIKKSEPALQSDEIQILPVEDRRVFSFLRRNGQDELLVLHNLSDQKVCLDFKVKSDGSIKLHDLISEQTIPTDERLLKLSFSPYQSMILKPSDNGPCFFFNN